MRVETPDGSLAGTRVEFQVVKGPPTQLDFAQPVGLPVEIAPARPLPDAIVHLSFDAQKDLPAASPGAERPTPTNAFIAIYDPDLDVWWPLETRYLADAHELAATAPHFSLFQRFVVKPGKHVSKVLVGKATAVGEAAVGGAKKLGRIAVEGAKAIGEDIAFETDQLSTGVSALAAKAAKYGQQAVSIGLGKFLGVFPESQRIECDPPQAMKVPGYSVKVDNGHGMEGCVADVALPDDKGRWLRLENHLAAPFFITPRTALGLGWNQYDQRNVKDIGTVIGRYYSRLLDQGLVVANASAELRVPADAPDSFVVDLTMDYLPVAFDAFFGVLAVIPAVASVEVAMGEVAARFVSVTLSDAAITITESVFFERFAAFMDQELLGGVLDTAKAILEGLVCVREGVRPESSHSVEGVVTVVQRCGQPVLERIGTSAGPLHLFAGLLGVIELPSELLEVLVNGLATPTVRVSGPRRAPPVTAPQAACPIGPECLDDVAIDLDGDSTSDRLGIWIDASAGRVMATGKTATGMSSTIELTTVSSIRGQSPNTRSILKGSKNLDGRPGNEAIVLVALGDIGHFTILTWGDGSLINLISSGNSFGLGSGGAGGFDSQTSSLTEQFGFYCVRQPAGDYLLLSWTSSLRRSGGAMTYSVKETAAAILNKRYVAQPSENRTADVVALPYSRKLEESGCLGADIMRPALTR